MFEMGPANLNAFVTLSDGGVKLASWRWVDVWRITMPLQTEIWIRTQIDHTQ